MGYSKNEYDEKSMARALGKDLSISTKVSIEMCKYLRNKSTKRAKQILSRVLEKKEAIPFTRFNWDMGHKPGDMGPGRYPQKASEELLALIKSVEANASSKGLSVDNLVISHLVAQKASRPWHYGRQRRRQMKRTHIEIMVKEAETKAKPAKESVKSAPEPKKETPKPKAESKPATKEETPKAEKQAEVKEK
ncbi:50S ribosomal protein L22 [Candidatus Woesearchaeota archaeon]|nr:MAG: 50S ribosomal protein L22 [Candidatus Woesearchaeota archaeon]